MSLKLLPRRKNLELRKVRREREDSCGSTAIGKGDETGKKKSNGTAGNTYNPDYTAPKEEGDRQDHQRMSSETRRGTMISTRQKV